MSIQHHGTPDPINEAARQRFIDEICGRAAPAFPQGKIHKDDQGETAFGIGSDKRHGIVMIRFTKPCDWIGLDKASALNMAKILTDHANNL